MVCSGGQGRDEVISEAEAISRELIRRGVPKRRIVIEDKSKSTYENVYNSKEILDKRTEGREYRVAIVTNNFHVYRSRWMAEYAGFSNPMTLSAKTPTTLFYQSIFREICATIVSWIKYK